MIVEESEKKITLTVTVSPTLARFLCTLVEQEGIPDFWSNMALALGLGRETLVRELKRIEAINEAVGAPPTSRAWQSLNELWVLEMLAHRLSS